MNKFVSDRIYLRPFLIEEAETVAKVCNDKNLSQYVPLPYPYKLKDAKEWIESLQHSRKEKAYAVILKENNRLIGSVGLTIFPKKHFGEVGYWIDPKFWGNGYATEAVKKIVEISFLKLKLHKIFAKHYIENVASGKVLKKTGMTLIGTLSKQSVKNGQYHDMCLYEIVNLYD